MIYPSFAEFVALREGTLLSDRQPARGVSRINPFPATVAHRVRLRVKRCRKYKPFPATVRAVVPPGIVPKNLKPW